MDECKRGREKKALKNGGIEGGKMDARKDRLKKEG